MTKTFMLLVHADADGWADLDDAERLATSISDAASAHLTVRELMPLPGLPREVPSPIRQPI